jgi:hypothetical protein
MKFGYLILIALCAFGMQSCEDDPILSPGTSKPKGGSYGKTSLPEVHSDTNVIRQAPTNPEIF